MVEAPGDPALEAVIDRASSLFDAQRYEEAFIVLLRGVSRHPSYFRFQLLAVSMINLVDGAAVPWMLRHWVEASRFGTLDNAAAILGEMFDSPCQRYELGSMLGGVMVKQGDPDRMMAFFSLCLADPRDLPLPTETVVEEYAAKAGSYDSNTMNVRNIAAFLAFLGARLGERKGLAVVDMPCGTGTAAAGLRPFAASLTGGDLSPHMLDRARAGGLYDSLLEGDMLELLPGLEADLLVSHGSLYYFADLAPVAVAASRALRPGGLFAFTDFPAPEGTMATVDGNFRYCRAPELVRRVLTGHGFAEEAMEPSLAYGLPSLYWLFRKL